MDRTVAECLAARSCWYAQASLDAGRVSFDGAAAALCVGRMFIGDTCDYWFDDPMCENVITGKVPDNGSCRVDDECAATSWCAGGTCPGTCQPRKGLPGRGLHRVRMPVPALTI